MASKKWAKAQLSFEFLVYVAVSGASLALMLGMFARSQAAQSNIRAAAYTGELAASINANMAYGSSSFSAYVPEGLCGAAVVDGTLVTRFGNFTLDGPLMISRNALCPGQGIERLSMAEEYNGTYVLQLIS
jgi:hypothetical protein